MQAVGVAAFVLAVCSVQGYATFEEFLSRQSDAAHTKDRTWETSRELFNILEDVGFSNLKMAKILGNSLAAINSQHKFQKKKPREITQNIVNFRIDGDKEGQTGVSRTDSDVSRLDDQGQCFSDLVAFVEALKNETTWALKMVDSFGKPGPGILEGRVTWTGDYDECVSVAASYAITDKSGNDGRFSGRYCSGNLAISLSPSLKIPVTGWGLCLPDSCDSDDAAYFISQAIALNKNISKIVTPESVYCHHPLGAPPRLLAVGTLIAFFVLIVIIATLVDLVFLQWPIWRLEAINQLGDADRLRTEAEALNHNDHDITLLVVNTHIRDNMYSPNLAVRVLLCFSAWSNSKKIWNTRQGSGSLTCVNAIRVLSITWVILGHVLVVYQPVIENFLQAGRTHLERWTFMAIYNATVSVDSFFVLSGLLLTYLSLKEMFRQNGSINWPMFYFHRYIRLTPVMMICLAIFAATLPYWTDGPFWVQQGYDKNFCEDSWWGNLLYVNNLIKFKNPCFEWGWYLAVDMQYFVLSPLILIPLYRRPRLGYLAVAVFFLATTVTPFVLTYVHHYSAAGFAQVNGTSSGDDYNYQIYNAPYSRMGPYLIGMLTGYILYRSDCRFRIRWQVNLLIWALVTAVALAVLYGLTSYADGTKKIDLFAAALYNGLARSAWGACVAWVIFACVTGNGGLVNSLLSLPVWIPLSRLTYCVYLSHPIIMAAWAYSRRTPLYLDDMSLIMVFLSTLVATFAISFVVSLVFEVPVIGLEKIVFKREKRS